MGYMLKNKILVWAWHPRLLIPTVKRLELEDRYQLKARQGYGVSSRLALATE